MDQFKIVASYARTLRNRNQSRGGICQTNSPKPRTCTHNASYVRGIVVNDIAHASHDCCCSKSCHRKLQDQVHLGNHIACWLRMFRLPGELPKSHQQRFPTLTKHATTHSWTQQTNGGIAQRTEFQTVVSMELQPCTCCQQICSS